MSMEIPSRSGSEGDKSEESETIKTSTGETEEVPKLRGTLIEDLKTRQREDEEKSSRLRGTLLKQLEGVADEKAEVPKLRGTLLEKRRIDDETAETSETSRLRGKLLQSHETLEPYSKAWLMKQTFIQRDGKAEFFFDGFNPGLNGELIRIVCPLKGAATSQNLERFLRRLKTPGEAWSVKGN